MRLVLLMMLVGCGREAARAEVAPAYRADLENLCDAEARSGAATAGGSNGPADVVVAQWLGATLTTPESKAFLVSLAKLGPAAKGDALRREATRVGLPRCALAEAWK